jgi:hypothetical protein
MDEFEKCFEMAVAFIEARADQYRTAGHSEKSDDVALRYFDRAATCDFLAEDMRSVYLTKRQEIEA